ncbi:uncharacterized protein SPPG_02871 [Spizellomyces punctatus DAOM BR117]|uniref:Autophagy-related protein 27 n=1 Tax=Spizellomyces punctatus (strain DAOM BR117) TaxID=645134 RepID=A0A0L0HNK7_SPIPD|nr:uncharacterized protein SPPG_02871 [Spizellomyces punctatus DAOM BR117]KND02404.1 hypothetical protein SPPG_02871 [Spizellomyces punctatus DAOM BR117]|eukprot:XP_016610443.1 hypothetical protein SPPG_02871 [Spizellomyces punctatus DAOM BR117]
MRVGGLALTVLGFAASCRADCCYTSTPTTTQDQSLVNLTVYWSQASLTAYHYNVKVQFPVSNVMNAAQPFRAPVGTVVCEKEGENAWGCTSRDAKVFSAQFNMALTAAQTGSPSTTIRIGDENGEYTLCTLSPWCELPSDNTSNNDDINYGPFGHHPKWFAIILAGAGGLALGAIVFGVLYYRNHRSHIGTEVSLARRHEEQHGPSQEAKIKRVPTVRQARSGRDFAGSGTLLGGLPGNESTETLISGRGTLVGGMLYQASVEPVKGDGLERSKSIRSVHDTRSVAHDTSLMRQKSTRSVRDGIIPIPSSIPPPPPPPQQPTTTSPAHGHKTSRTVKRQGTILHPETLFEPPSHPYRTRSKSIREPRQVREPGLDGYVTDNTPSRTRSKSAHREQEQGFVASARRRRSTKTQQGQGRMDGPCDEGLSHVPKRDAKWEPKWENGRTRALSRAGPVRETEQGW